MLVHLLVGLMMLSPTVMPVEDKIDGALLVGKWKPEKLPENLDKIVIEYLKDGKLKVELTAQGMDLTGEGTYKIEGNKLSIDLEIAGNNQKQTRKIVKLTKDEMITKNEDSGDEERKFTRVK
ncbi:MAG TPA: hypothetical protein PLX97_05040 [Gemmatales bacterium]|nr:hypothetical protein [Gemmatales bacterium]